MIQAEFQEKFVEFMKVNHKRNSKKIIALEWEVFESFQNDMCRDVEFDEYLDIIQDDWMEY